jgi:hypothetical protein
MCSLTILTVLVMNEEAIVNACVEEWFSLKGRNGNHHDRNAAAILNQSSCLV